ncbi:MAG: hypothetical protein JAY69_04730, partial [Candidatus Thiodiazotropha taylori]|nr:hypothetical protein [Candidatus Thiodiazotropha taylori]MCW4231915.1 hypothetical protein [Candidatus Thiodiazotropha taylori]
MATSTTKKKAAPKAKSSATSRKKSTAKKSASTQTTKSAGPDKSTKSANDNRVLPGLMQGLQSVFDKIHKDNQIREDHHEKIIEEFSDRLTTAFQQTHEEAEERE